MAKKTPKPLFSLKNDFADSLEAFCQAGIMLEQQVRSAIELGCIDNRVKDLVQKRLDAFRAAMISDTD